MTTFCGTEPCEGIFQFKADVKHCMLLCVDMKGPMNDCVTLVFIISYFDVLAHHLLRRHTCETC